MNILLWIILGLVAGWLASVVMKTNNQQSMVKDILFGVMGAVIGGFVVNMFGGAGITGFNIYSLVVATLGAVLLIGIGKAIP